MAQFTMDLTGMCLIAIDKTTTAAVPKVAYALLMGGSHTPHLALRVDQVKTVSGGLPDGGAVAVPFNGGMWALVNVSGYEVSFGGKSGDGILIPKRSDFDDVEVDENSVGAADWTDMALCYDVTGITRDKIKSSPGNTLSSKVLTALKKSELPAGVGAYFPLDRGKLTPAAPIIAGSRWRFGDDCNKSHRIAGRARLVGDLDPGNTITLVLRKPGHFVTIELAPLGGNVEICFYSLCPFSGPSPANMADVVMYTSLLEDSKKVPKVPKRGRQDTGIMTVGEPECPVGTVEYS